MSSTLQRNQTAIKSQRRSLASQDIGDLLGRDSVDGMGRTDDIHQRLNFAKVQECDLERKYKDLSGLEVIAVTDYNCGCNEQEESTRNE